jgi:hypothetical protein
MVTVNPLGLNPGTYTGQISITGQGVANGSQIVNVTYLITGAPAPAVTKIQNAASAVIGPVAPGEIISIFGSNLGPVQPVTTGVSAAGFFPTTLSGTQVLFDNIPAAMWYTSSTQINAVVPYEIGGRASTVMQVVYNSSASSPVNLQVAPTAPGIFFSSGGQAAVDNADGSINSAFQSCPPGYVDRDLRHGRGRHQPAGRDRPGDSRCGKRSEESDRAGVGHDRGAAGNRAVRGIGAGLCLRRVPGERRGSELRSFGHRGADCADGRQCQQPGAGDDSDSIAVSYQFSVLSYQFSVCRALN